MIDYNQLIENEKEELNRITDGVIKDIFIGNNALNFIFIFIYLVGVLFTLWEFSINILLEPLANSKTPNSYFFSSVIF